LFSRFLPQDFGPFQGQSDPLIDPVAELFEIRQLAAHFGQLLCAYEAGGLLAVMDVIEMVVRSVTLRLTGVLAAAAWLATDMVLAGETAGTQWSQGAKLDFEVFDFVFDDLNSWIGFHISDILFMLSDNCHSNLPPPTEQGFCAWLATAQQRLDRLAHTPATSLGDLEIAVVEELHRLGASLLTQAANRQAQATAFLCSRCQQPLAREAKNHVRKIDSVVGPLQLSRDYGWCPKCQDWCYPADARWGLQPNAPASPRVQEMAAEAVLKMPCAQAEQSLPRLGGCSLSSTTLHREASRQGKRALALQQADQHRATTVEGVVHLAAQAAPPQKPFVLIIELDAWNIRERSDWGRTKTLRKKGKEPERWHWVYTATLFRLDQRGHTAAKRPVITDRGYVATRAGLEAFEQLVYAEALRRGLTKAAEVLVIADGAIWIWNLVESRFRRATQRVDLYHVKQHLWSVARELYDQDTAQARQWLRPLFHQLKNKSDGGQQVLGALKELLRNKEKMTPVQREQLAKEIGYFTTHAHRMNYASAQRKQQPLGSGAIESTCRQYQVRFKRSGQFWSLAGDEALLALETLRRNERWSLLFPHSHRQPVAAAQG